jgi:hypothetical protein
MEIAIPSPIGLLRNRRAAPPSYEHLPKELVMNYLAALRLHTQEVLERNLDPETVESTSIEFILTVSSAWIDKSPEWTVRCCAESAGMGVAKNLHIISEPEAAAVYAFQKLAPEDLSFRDGFTLCDAGGGTVDLTSYRITSLKPRLEVDEISEGCSAFCRSSIVDHWCEVYTQDCFEAVLIDILIILPS